MRNAGWEVERRFRHPGQAVGRPARVVWNLFVPYTAMPREFLPQELGYGSVPHRHPDSPYADRAYDFDKHRKLVRARGIEPRFARRGTEHGTELGAHR